METRLSSTSQESNYDRVANQGNGILVQLRRAVGSLFDRIVSFSAHERVRPRSGYHYEMQELTQAQLKPHLKYIALAAYGHTSPSNLVMPFGYNPLHPNQLGIDPDCMPGMRIQGGVQLKTNECVETEPCFFHPQTGLKITILVNPQTKEIVLAYGPRGGLKVELNSEEELLKEVDSIQCKHAWGSLFGKETALHDHADFYTEIIISQIKASQDYEGYNIQLVGLCLGGNIAQYVALKQDLQARCFNTWPMGAALQKKIIAARPQALENADQNVKHLTVRTDFASDLIGAGFWVKFFSCLGLRTPGNFGERYCIPSAYAWSDIYSTHMYVFGSAMHYLTIGKRALPKDLPFIAPYLLRG